MGNKQDQRQRDRQGAAWGKRLSDLEASLTSASDLIAQSKREVQRSRGLLQDQRDQKMPAHEDTPSEAILN